MWKSCICVAGLGLMLRGAAAQYSEETVDYARYVNPFIGSEGALRGYACELLHCHVL